MIEIYRVVVLGCVWTVCGWMMQSTGQRNVTVVAQVGGDIGDGGGL